MSNYLAYSIYFPLPSRPFPSSSITQGWILSPFPFFHSGGLNPPSLLLFRRMSFDISSSRGLEVSFSIRYPLLAAIPASPLRSFSRHFMQAYTFWAYRSFFRLIFDLYAINHCAFRAHHCARFAFFVFQGNQIARLSAARFLSSYSGGLNPPSLLLFRRMSFAMLRPSGLVLADVPASCYTPPV